MIRIKGTIRTNMVGSECEFEFEMPDNATDKEIEDAARDAAFEFVDWYYEVEDEA